MPSPSLTLRDIRARPVILKLRRPVAMRIATMTDWPIILIDLTTEEGIVGRSYLEPYVPKAMKYLIPALHDLGEMLRGTRLSPIDVFGAARRSLHFVGYEGQSQRLPYPGSTWRFGTHWRRQRDCHLRAVGRFGWRPRTYNSNGLWLKAPEVVAEEAAELATKAAFAGLKLRLGRDRPPTIWPRSGD